MSDTTIAALIGGAIGSGITGIFALITIWMQRRSEERRQIRELAVKVALENWKIYYDVTPPQGQALPIDVYLIHAMHLVSALDGRLKTPDQIREHLRQSLTAGNAATAEIDEHNKKIQAERQKGAV